MVCIQRIWDVTARRLRGLGRLDCGHLVSGYFGTNDVNTTFGDVTARRLRELGRLDCG
jgi:hypothetical protein